MRLEDLIGVEEHHAGMMSSCLFRGMMHAVVSVGVRGMNAGSILG